MAQAGSKDFIQKRLDSLNEIDNNIVTLLDNIGALFNTYMEPETENAHELNRTKEKFVEGTKSIYSLLGSIATGLRKEVKIMDENIGVYDKNDENVMILPISVDQKRTSLGRDRLEQEIKNMEQLVGGEAAGDAANESPKEKEADAMDISSTVPETKDEGSSANTAEANVKDESDIDML